MMKELFVSYHYTGKINHTIYTGFGNAFVEFNAPVDYERLEVLNRIVSDIALKEKGMESISCDILFFK